MRLLIVGSSSQGALELAYVKYLKQIVADVEIFDAQGLFFRYYGKKFLNKLIFRIGLSRIYNRISKALLQHVNYFKPDIILVFKGMEILPQTLKFLKASGIKLANYNPDNPFLFTGRGSGNSNVTASLNLFDVHITYSRDILEKFKKINLTSKLLPFGHDATPELCAGLQNIEENKRICFIGTADKQRAVFFNKLAEEGIEIDIYGTRWRRFGMHKNIHLYDAVYGREFWETMWKYRVQINILRKHNITSHGMRSFEIPAIGGIQVANDTPEHRSFFEDGKEIFLFENIQGCVANINQLLSFTDTQATLIRNRAKHRSATSNYSYYHRAAELYNILKELT